MSPISEQLGDAARVCQVRWLLLLTGWDARAVVPLPGFGAEGIGADGGQRTPLGASIVWPVQDMQVTCMHAPQLDQAIACGTTGRPGK